MEKPSMVNIMGINYVIEYVDSPFYVDSKENPDGKRRKAMVNYETRTIRIFDKGRATSDIFVSLLHEVIHTIVDEMLFYKSVLKKLSDGENETWIEAVSLHLSDFLHRNKFLQ